MGGCYVLVSGFLIRCHAMSIREFSLIPTNHLLIDGTEVATGARKAFISMSDDSTHSGSTHVYLIKPAMRNEHG